MTELEAQIESYLFTERRWVKAEEICARFGLADKRALRAVGKKRGICSKFAISNTRRGLRHIVFATETEVYHAYRQRRKHAVGEMVNARDMLRTWKQTRSLRPSNPPMEKTGQYILVES